jgi:hypothetical protein
MWGDTVDNRPIRLTIPICRKDLDGLCHRES